MWNNLKNSLNKEPGRSFGFLSLMVVLKIIIQRVLYSQGFISVAADEFARGIRAAKWVQNPNFNIITDIKDTWLPFEKYLNGSMLFIWHDVIWAPRLTVFIASCLVLIALFLLIYILFDQFVVAALASLFIVFQPWYVWLSGTPMLEMYYLACFLWGLVFLVNWLKKGKHRAWFWAGFCFMIASDFHVQSWTYINLVNLITVGYLYQFFVQRRHGDFLRLIGFYLIGNSLIITFSTIEYLNTGRFFGFLAKHTNYSKWFYDGYSVTIWDKVLYYPKLIVENSSSVIWVLVIMALFFLVRDRKPKWGFLPLLIATLALITNCAMNIISVPPTAVPGRYSIFYLLMISPYLAYGVYRLGLMGNNWTKSISRFIPTLLSAILLLYSIGWGIDRLPDYPRIANINSLNTGYFINQKLNQSTSDNTIKYMLELRYWEYLAVELTAGHFDTLVYDREVDLYNRNTPSVFTDPSADPYSILATQNVRYVALREPSLKDRTAQLPYLIPIEKIGSWVIYEFQPNPD